MTCKASWRSALGAFALSTTLTLTACAGSSSGVREIVRRDLPAAPAYLQPVAVPDPRAGERTIEVAARERAGRLKANTIIRNARAQWDKLRAAYRRAR